MVNITTFKNNLSRYLRSVQRGSTLIIKDRETPIARLVPYRETPARLVARTPTRSLAEVDKLPFFRPKALRRGDADAALAWTRQDRS